MFSVGERGFHLFMGTLLGAAVLVDNLAGDFVPGWRSPEVHLLTFVVGMVWVSRYAGWRAELQNERERVLADRIERLDQNQRALEDDLRERFRRPL